MIKKLLCVVLSGSMIFGNAGITMASETEPKTVQENVNEETDSPEESFSEEDIFEDGISADDEAAELPDSTEQELEEEPEEADNIEMSEDTENLSEEPETEEMAESDDFSDGEEDAVSASASMMDGGITGDIAWSIDTSGCLTLKGNGDYDTSDYYWDAERGWSKWQDDIKTAIVEISGITKTRAMFKGCRNLTRITFKNCDFSKVTDMAFMFSDCESLTQLDTGSLKTGNVSHMQGMFRNCSKLKTLDVSKFDTSKVNDMNSMFLGCESLTQLNVRNFNTSRVTRMSGMFRECRNLKQLDVSRFNTANVTTMEEMFYCCESLTQLNVSNFNTANVVYMNGMFERCESLTQLNVRNFNTSNVEDMGKMFCTMSKLKSLDLNSFNTSNVQNMYFMFYGNESLTSLNIKNFDTSKVVDMNSMFGELKKMTSLDVSEFNTSKVKSMEGMFSRCYALKAVDVSHFNTSEVVKMGYMFNSCSSLESLNLSKFNTSSVNDARYMLYYIDNLKTLKTIPNLKCSIELPFTMSDSSGKKYTTMPTNSKCITLKVVASKPVVRKSIKTAKVTVKTATYNGSPQKPGVTVKLGNTTLKSGTDYTVTYSNNTKTGTKAVAKITGKGSYKDSVSKYFTIKACSLDGKVQVNLKTTIYTWDGQAKTPAFSIYMPKANAAGMISLQNEKDYTYKYLNNKEPGTATLQITGKGNFTGTKKIAYKISKAKQPVKVTPGSITKLYTDKGKSYKISVSGKKEFAKVTYSTTNAKIASVKNSKIMLNGEGVATVTVKVAATKHYQAQNIAIKINVLKRQNITTAVKNGAKIAYSTTMKSLGAKVPSEGGKLTYKSLDTSIVSVDSKGNLNFKKAKKLGKVTIQITAAKSSSYAPATRKLTITTVKGTPSVSCVQQQERKIYDGAFNLGAKADQNATLVYSSSNSAIASVASDGTVTLKEWQENDIQREVQITVTTKSTTFYNAAKPVIVNLTVIKKKNLQQRIEDEKIKFPDGKFWNHVVNSYSDLTDNLDSSGAPERFQDTISDVPCKHHGTQSGIDPIPGNGEYDCNKFDGAIQCDGFARKVFYDIWEGQRVSGLQRIYDNNVQVGDYVRINNNGHSAIVTEVYSDSFKVIECNLDGDGRHHNCLLRHNWTYSKSSVTYRVHAVNYSLN